MNCSQLLKTTKVVTLGFPPDVTLDFDPLTPPLVAAKAQKCLDDVCTSKVHKNACKHILQLKQQNSTRPDVNVERLESIPTLRRKLGEGSFGSVYSGDWNGQEVAIKRINHPLRLARPLELNEYAVGAYFAHPNLASLHSLYIDPSTRMLFVTMPLAMGDLKKFPPRTLRERQVVCYQLLLGTKFLHSYGVWHLDLKPENILVVGYSIENEDATHIQISDFGVASTHRQTDRDCETVITANYRPIELLVAAVDEDKCEKVVYGEAADAWSIGVILLWMIAGRKFVHGFSGRSVAEILTNIISLLGNPLTSADTHSCLPLSDLSRGEIDELKKYPSTERTSANILTPNELEGALLTSLLTYDPTHRITIEEALMVEYFDGVRGEMERLYNQSATVDDVNTLPFVNAYYNSYPDEHIQQELQRLCEIPDFGENARDVDQLPLVMWYSVLLFDRTRGVMEYSADALRYQIAASHIIAMQLIDGRAPPSKYYDSGDVKILYKMYYDIIQKLNARLLINDAFYISPKPTVDQVKEWIAVYTASTHDRGV